MNHTVTALLLLVLTIVFSPAPAQTAPQSDLDALRSSLLERWERAQLEDPQTRRFETIGERRYRFSTERFPFDGELQVVNVSLDDLAGRVLGGYVIGMVEVELLDLPDGFMQRHAHSVAQWRSHHQFYHDERSGQWLSPAEWQRSFTDAAPPDHATGGGLGCIVNWVYVVLIVVFVAAVALLIRRASRQFRSAATAQDEALSGQRRALALSEQALENARQSRELLTEIRDLLREQARR
jgi:hypothetical protein